MWKIASGRLAVRNRARSEACSLDLLPSRFKTNRNRTEKEAPQEKAERLPVFPLSDANSPEIAAATAADTVSMIAILYFPTQFTAFGDEIRKEVSVI